MNIKIDSGKIKAVQQSLLELQKARSTEIKKELLEIRSDGKKISKDSLNLKDIDSENSTISFSPNQINFNLVFNPFNQIQLNANGKLKLEEKSIEVIFQYSFPREIIENGKTLIMYFMLDLKMKAYFEEKISVDRRIEKEDILKFIQKIVNEIFDTFNDSSKSLRSVLINKENLKKITKAGKDDLAGLLQSLLGSVFSFIKYKELSSKKSLKVEVVLHTDRKKHPAKEYIITKLESFSIEIQQVDIDNKDKL